MVQTRSSASKVEAPAPVAKALAKASAEGVGPAQPPAGFVTMLVLQDTMVRILSFREGMLQARTFPSTSGGSQIR
ncbi:hypothetical protein HAX54_045924, partial [Datura stramonium]|nr:hypothetical protein [Datura stramonium]